MDRPLISSTRSSLASGLPSVPRAHRKSSWRTAEGKEILLCATSQFTQLVNAAGICQFAVQLGPDYPLISYLNAATGWGKLPEEYLEIGNRIQQLRQAFNVRHGKVPGRDFRPPKRMEGNPPLTSGPLKGVRIPFEELNRKVTKAMGWDEEGRPLPRTLRELGLEEIAEEMERIGEESPSPPDQIRGKL